MIINQIKKPVRLPILPNLPVRLPILPNLPVRLPILPVRLPILPILPILLIKSLIELVLGFLIQQ
jgi:hypothetical protein